MAGGLPLLISGASFGEWGAMDDEPEMEGASGTDGVTAAEAAQFERTRFEHSMATIGIGMGLSLGSRVSLQKSSTLEAGPCPAI